MSEKRVKVMMKNPDILEDVVKKLKAGKPEEDVLKAVGRLKDVVVERVEDGPVSELLIRGLEGDTGQRFKAAAGARGMRYADYLAALVALHDAMRRLADGGNEAVRADLERLGLTTVTL